MDRNTIVGIILIVGILVVYGIFSTPSKEDIEAQRKMQDSLIRVEKKRQMDEAAKTAIIQNKEPVIQSNSPEMDLVSRDSLENENRKRLYGSFAQASQGKNEWIVIENELIRAKIATRGGRLWSVELKKYKTYDQRPLILFEGDSTIFNITFHEQQNLRLYDISTGNLFFSPVKQVKKEPGNSVSLRLYAAEDKYLQYTYTLDPNSYMMKFNISLHGLDSIFSPNENTLSLKWQIDVPQQEKGKKFESTYTTIYYKYSGDDVENLSETSNDDETLRTKFQWMAFKQQYFSSVLIADNHFLNGFVAVKDKINSNKYLKNFTADLTIPYENTKNSEIPLRFYFGPNHYNTLTQYDLQLERIIPLGWSFFLMHWINRFAVIPVFNFLEQFLTNYGLIILILTILLKLVLTPLTYRSYLSSAKMRVLKPQVDEALIKIPKEKNMERQQATMALYRRAGVNPMGGCIPSLIQLPILIAMFRFFPTSIELRQKSFLWADDLSSYDSILSWTTDIPLLSSFYGNHISLFCILMSVTNIIYTVMTSNQMSTGTQMPGMKTMMYLMPVMFLFFFNNYSSGLSYYYFVSTLITIGQTMLIRRMVNDEELLKKLETNKKKPAKKSRFQERLEKIAKNRGYKLPNR